MGYAEEFQKVSRLSCEILPPISESNPYQELMGEAWQELAPGIRVGMTPPLEAKGILQVTHAHRGVAGLIARAVKLPPEGDVDTRLTLTSIGGKVRWVRQYGDFKAESLQTFDGRHFLETAGPFTLVIAMEPRGSALAHVQVGAKVFGISVPRFLAPLTFGILEEGSNGRSWRLRVDIGHPWFGTVLGYRGEMEAQ